MDPIFAKFKHDHSEKIKAYCEKNIMNTALKIKRDYMALAHNFISPHTTLDDLLRKVSITCRYISPPYIYLYYMQGIFRSLSQNLLRMTLHLRPHTLLVKPNRLNLHPSFAQVLYLQLQLQTYPDQLMGGLQIMTAAPEHHITKR